METVLVVGASGHIGVSAIIAARRSGLKVLAIVRNQESGEKLLKRVGSSEGITLTEASVVSDTGVASVVEKVRARKLPAFQHVWASSGGVYVNTPLEQITTADLRKGLAATFEANFFAYCATIGYLKEQNYSNSTWTVCTGYQGELGLFPLPAISQGALFSFCIAGMRENENTNVRFNEVLLCHRVEHDEDAVAHGVTKASDFAKVYEMVLAHKDVRSKRIRVFEGDEKLDHLKLEDRIIRF